MSDTYRSRRSCLTVPGSNPRFLHKAMTAPADQIIIDLEDAVAPDSKASARHAAVEALSADGWGVQERSVRVNDWSTRWTYEDLIEVVSEAGEHIDSIVLPKVRSAHHVRAADLLLTQLEKAHSLEVGSIGIDAQVEDAAGMTDVDAIAAASPRLVALVFGPVDFMASIAMPSPAVDARPAGHSDGDAFHDVLMRLLVAARTHGKLAIDGPYLRVRDRGGLRRSATRTAALGFDGKWVVHPDQITVVNETFSPSQRDFDHAENILAAYDYYTSRAGGSRGAAMLGDEMIDEASRKLAQVVAAKGRAASMLRADVWQPPLHPPA